MVSISTPVCVNFELRPGAGDIHICWFNFDALVLIVYRINAYIRTYVHTYIRIYIYTYTHADIRTHQYIHLHIDRHTYVHTLYNVVVNVTQTNLV